VLARVRRAKTEAGRSLRAGVTALAVTGPSEMLAQVDLAAGDLAAASGAAPGTLTTGPGPELAVAVTLAAD
jgi:hypothetical protein